MDELSTSLSNPPDWSITVGDAGRVFVIAATALLAISLLAWLFEPKAPKLRKLGIWSFIGGCFGLFATFVSLGTLFVANRFEYEYVWSHADSTNTIPYRIAGIWSGQQGSFLLWACAAAVFGLFAVRCIGDYRRWFTVAYAGFLGSLGGILAYESPFNLIRVDGQVLVPMQGRGLAPSLQNYWVTIHPPTIFLGFGSLTVLAALAFAALAKRDYESWIRLVRPWAILSTTLLGLGLCMGGFWAYETLGWGGFWMWDPVENVSFVPWCFVAALMHGVMVQITKGKWKIGNLLMAGLPFFTFVYGTFLTRSGMLSDVSVHSFAEMNRSALWLLVGFMSASTLSFLGLWTYRAFQAKAAAQPDEAKGAHREGFYLAGVLMLIMMGLATMIGMSVPFFMALAGKPAKVVEEGLYHQVLPWIYIPIMILMAVTPFVSWRKMPMREVAGKAYTLLCITVGMVGLALLLAVSTPFGKYVNLSGAMTFPGGLTVKALPWMLVLVGSCTLVLAGNIWRVAELVKRSKLGVTPFLAHAGVAILMAGLIISRGFEQKEEAIVMENHPGQILQYFVKYQGMTSDVHDRNNKVRLGFYDVKDPEKKLFEATPGYYLTSMDGQESPMVWPYIQRYALHDVYVSLRPPQTQASDDIPLAIGQHTTFSGIDIEYLGMEREGEAGMAGTKFVAKLKVSADGKSKVVTPKFELGAGGPPIQHPAALDSSLQVVMSGMNAADKSVRIQVQMTRPMYPIEVFHKPMVGLVWLGTGLLTFAGFAAAFYRRVSRKTTTSVEEIAATQPRTSIVPHYRRQT